MVSGVSQCKVMSSLISRIKDSCLSKIKSPSENRNILSGRIVELDSVETDLKKLQTLSLSVSLNCRYHRRSLPRWSFDFYLSLDLFWLQPFSTGAVNVWHSVNHLVSESKSYIAQYHQSKDAPLHLEYLHSCSPGRVKCLYISGGLTNLGNMRI